MTKLDAMAPLAYEQSGGELLATSTLLVDTASWVGSAEGYWNLRLAFKACDIAAAGLARLIADLRYPLEGPAEQLRRCRLPIFTPPARARVLNYEAGAALFPTNAASADELRNHWAVRAYRASRQQRPINPLTEPGMAWFSLQTRTHLQALGLDPDRNEPGDAFAQDEICPAPGTTSACWNTKLHEPVASGSIPGRLGSAESLLIFREKTGDFPQETTETFPSFRPAGKRAFKQAWKAHVSAGDADELLFDDAWGAYEAVRENRLLDYDSNQTRYQQRGAGRVTPQQTPDAASPSAPLPSPPPTGASPTVTARSPVASTTGTPARLRTPGSPTRSHGGLPAGETTGGESR